MKNYSKTYKMYIPNIHIFALILFSKKKKKNRNKRRREEKKKERGHVLGNQNSFTLS